MLENNSPWIAQLKRKRPVKALSSSIKTDIAVVGGGIAGVTTAYYILTMTDHDVTLLEADKIAHGATGHNAGQVVHYFEKPFSDIVQEYGIEMAADAQNAILSAWDLLDDLYDNAKLETPVHRFTGYAGCTSYDQLMEHMENKYLRGTAGIHIEEIAVAEHVQWLDKIPARYKGLYSVMPQSNILGLLETDNKSYIAVLSTQKAVMNSALFTEELVGFLLAKYAKRFHLYEMSAVNHIDLDKSEAVLKTEKATVTCKKVVLCTNGFEHFTIENKLGFAIDTKFHLFIEGIVGYMAGYLEPLDKPPVAISYFTEQLDDEGGMIYYYLTRRPYEMEKNMKHNLVCIGGPEAELHDKKQYIRDKHLYALKTLSNIDTFLKHTYKPFPKDKIEFKFHWHGLMGYTHNLLRLIGKEPCNTNLLYNLGCNGVGILPSIYGAKKIGKHIRGDTMKKTVFDPLDTRCLIK